MRVLKRSARLATVTILLIACLPAHVRAQVAPSAYGPADTLWLGAEYSNSSASFPYQSGQRIEGMGAFAAFDFRSRIGLEGDARFWSQGGFEGSTEKSYLAGPRAFLLTSGRFRPYGKFLIGVGAIHYPFTIGDDSYFALAPGGGAEYRVSPRWTLRAEYEYQVWVNSPGFTNEPDHPLTPNGVHVGIAYRLLRSGR